MPSTLNDEDKAPELVRSSKIPGFVTPDYEGRRCISSLPDTFAELLGVSTTGGGLSDPRFKEFVEGGGEQIENVVFLLLDGFGSKSIEVAKQQKLFPSFGRLEERSLVLSLTSVFPSTTSSATTSLHTGLTPQQHGVLGYTTYMREIGAIVQMLDFSPVFSRRSLFELGFEPEEFLGRGKKTIHERFSEAGIPARLYLSRYIVGSGLSQITNRGAQIVPVLSAADLFSSLRRDLEKTKGSSSPSFHFAYHASPDTVAHARGPFSEHYASEIESIFHVVYQELFERLDRGVAKKTLFLISADHGLAQIDQSGIIDIARHGVLRLLKVPPTGDSRCIILHAKSEGEIQSILSYFEKTFPGQFLMINSKVALRDGLFGSGEVRDEVAERIGDVIAVPRTRVALDNSNVQSRVDYVPGRHGGLSFEEMVVPLIASRLGS